ncbi:hypothetical protein [Nocardia sp. NPDC003345]
MAVVVAMGTYTSFGPIRPERGIRLDSVDGKSATIIPGSTTYFLLYQLIWTGFAVLFLSAGIEIAAAAWGTHWPLALIVGCLGLCSASAPVLALMGRLRTGRIVLTDDEVIHEGWSSRTRIAWDDISRLLTAFEQGPLIIISGSPGARWDWHASTPTLPVGKQSRQIWMLDRPARTGQIVLECNRMAVDGYRLYRFLGYYADRPEGRPELGTAASVDRWWADLDR